MVSIAADSVQRFVKWWNARCHKTGRLEEGIPRTPRATSRRVRFRRTLAWFIYRIPGGRIALGLQYGHLRGHTSDGYRSRMTGGLRDVFPMEEALAVAAETLQDGALRLGAGERVSGPAAAR